MDAAPFWREREPDRGSPPTGRELDTIRDRHGFRAGPATLLSSTGLVNWVYSLGDDAVLRIPIAGSRDAISDAYTESVAVPAVTAARIRTPELLVFDDDRDVIDRPYTIYSRVPGTDLGTLDLDASEAHTIYADLGRELAALHARVSSVPDPHGLLDQPDRWREPTFARDLFDRGYLDRNAVEVIDDMYVRLASSLDGADTHRRFLHQDLKSTNAMAAEGRFAAIIDWGDAGWGDPALEFRYLPMRAVDWALAGYREIMPLDGDASAEARILWDQLWCATWQLDVRPAPRHRGSDRDRPGARLIDLLGFVVSPRGREWLFRAGL